VQFVDLDTPPRKQRALPAPIPGIPELLYERSIPQQRPVIRYDVPKKKTLVHAGGLTVENGEADPDSQTFRFKRHGRERQALVESLPLIRTTPKGKRRFMCCGEGAVVQYSPELGSYRVKSRTCGHRWCPACRERFAATLRDKITLSMSGAKRFEFKFITLTLRSSTQPLRDEVTHLFASFRRLRQTTLWKRRVAWGVAILEITINPVTKLFHPHLHIIAKCGFIPRKALSKTWEKASDGSCVSDIRAITNASAAVHYMTKYVTKGSYDEAAQAAGIDAAEQINALYRKKTVLWFGNRPVPEEEEDKPHEEKRRVSWINVTGLDNIIFHARHGVERAIALLGALDSGATQVPLYWDLPSGYG
jgi:hypothetical protein